MDPPYQRRSIWNQAYKDFFIDTVLNDYPCPAIFLYEKISPEGNASYSVVDGKQRLLTLFQFANNEFPVYSEAASVRLRDKYFKDLDDDTKRSFWRYQFSVEFVPSEDEALITNIFDRINRNVAKLTKQELRHAKFSGVFISRVEELSEWTFTFLPRNFPFIQPSSRKQMKDDEFVAQLLLLIEEGAKYYSQEDLDAAFSSRDLAWENDVFVTSSYRDSITRIRAILDHDTSGDLVRSRLRNQADFYSLVGAIHSMSIEQRQIDNARVPDLLRRFISMVEDASGRAALPDADAYYAASRSASNDQGPRQTRITIMKSLLMGAVPVGA